MRLVVAKDLIPVGFPNLCSLHSAGHEMVKEESSTVTDTARKGVLITKSLMVSMYSHRLTLPSTPTKPESESP